MLVDLAALRDALLTLTGAREGGKELTCPLKFKQGRHGTDAVVDCARCAERSSLSDPACRLRLVRSLSGKAWMDRLILERNIVREYGGSGLTSLLGLVSFYDDMKLQSSTLQAYGCGRCSGERRKSVMRAAEASIASPQEAWRMAASIQIMHGKEAQECRPCIERYASFRNDLARICARVKCVDARPYVRPRFSTSRIMAEPPDGAIFLRSYEISGDRLAPAIHVTIYEMADSLERLYFMMPWEYSMEEEDISLIVEARQRLLSKRPETMEFMDASNMRPLFARYGKEAISNTAAAKGLRLEPGRLEMLASVLVKYTCGLGILEDVLRDPHIEDAYVNAPVGFNPLHVVVDGEECTSNIFLSEADVESTISRLRAISGRPFSEANPVLDMDLGEFHTRVSAIGNPLSRGLAYAFRRHKTTPWTLPQLVSKKMLTPYAAGLLSLMVDGQSSILVTGTRGAGKTSLLGALMLEIPQSCRILVIEDTPELPVEDMQRCGWKVQGMGTRAPISGSEAEFQASDVLRAALRLGESALIMGEVRGAEARSLYEAMRVGASGNAVMGTIHGSSCMDVYDRVVHDIGVPPASFKATDAVVVCSTVRRSGGQARERRVIQVAEVSRSRWEDAGGAFDDLLVYDASADFLAPADRIDTGRSEALQKIAKKWGVPIKTLNDEVEARSLFMAQVAGKPWAMEAEAYARCVNAYRAIRENGRREGGPYFKEWADWLEREGAYGG
ncbi:putative type II secretion system protein E [Methanocella conradii HZ254]|uniref:Type II secretion system protein E n=1 Tax=Methanocella conradii (strain DSM 24694 / JCM 17849 / CGMCC 1.5162 / HZ254) TaxID=1041930 RepID=H8IA69_METCZ|nr:type II/IV secretion system ATPase subunit [Methanocella conradii]AFC99135.1 putative type II secretion system protein E [Methanocella conradii HZ254]